MSQARIKRPAYQWYVSEANDDEIFCLMTYEQQGIYRALLDRQWVEGSIPADVDLLAALCPKMPAEKFKACWPLISTKFQAHGEGRLINAKLKAQELELNEWLASQQRRAAKGGRRKAANIRKQRAALGLPNASPNASQGLVAKRCQSPSSISLSLSSTPETTEQSPEAPTAGKAPSSRTREFLTWFQGEYKARRNGATYFVKWEAHGAIVKRLLTAFPYERLQKHAQILLRTDEDWTTGTDRGIEILSAKINWLEDRLCAWEAQKRAREAV